MAGKISSVLICILLLYSNIISQTAINGFYSTGYGFDSNPLLGNNSESSSIFRNTFGIGYFPDYYDFRASYTGSVTSLLEFPERNYNVHSVKIDYTFKPFNYEYFELIIGSLANLRVNSIDAGLYDYAGINPELSAVLYSDFGIITLSYLPAYTKFYNFNKLNNLTNEVLISLDKTFEFETNINLELLYGIRNYNANANNHSNNSKIRQYHRSNSKNPNRLSPNLTFINQNAEILNLSAIINQPVYNSLNAGISLNINSHLNYNGFYYSSGTIDLYNNREFFDDYYNFEEKSINTYIDLTIFENLSFRATYTNYSRNFMYELKISNPEYSNDKRYDYGNNLTCELDATVFENFSFPENLNIKLKFDYFQNNSNLDEYQFETSSIFMTAIFDF